MATFSITVPDTQVSRVLSILEKTVPRNPDETDVQYMTRYMADTIKTHIKIQETETYFENLNVDAIVK